MATKTIAKLFRNGRSQAVRLPREFRFTGNCVSIRKVRDGVLLEPMTFNAEEWFRELDGMGPTPLNVKDRKQPKTPRRKIFE